MRRSEGRREGSRGRTGTSRGVKGIGCFNPNKPTNPPISGEQGRDLEGDGVHVFACMNVCGLFERYVCCVGVERG